MGEKKLNEAQQGDISVRVKKWRSVKGHRN